MPGFGERLRLLRHTKGLSQMEFAKMIKISKSSVNMYERGEREPGLETLEAIADFFNVDLDYLLGKSDFKNKFALVESLNGKDSEDIANLNFIIIAARDGSYEEKILTDEQLNALKANLEKLPDASDEI